MYNSLPSYSTVILLTMIFSDEQGKGIGLDVLSHQLAADRILLQPFAYLLFLFSNVKTKHTLMSKIFNFSYI